MLPVPSLLDSINTKSIALLATDVKTRKLIGVDKEIIEEAINSLDIGASILSRKEEPCGISCRYQNMRKSHWRVVSWQPSR